MRWINRRPRHPRIWALVPFVGLVGLYAVGSALRLAENPSDKLMPGASAMLDAWARLAFEADVRSGGYLLWEDTYTSLLRLGAGLSISALGGISFGLVLGVFPLARAALQPLVNASSMIPALAVLPILFIVFGVGEVSKVALIVIGTLPFITRDLAQRVREIPEEQWIKAQTLGASSGQLALRVVLPQVVPRLLDSLRLSLGPAWLFLISTEAISATSGLGYRIFLVRRYLAMDVIIPYVLWITLLAFLCDQALRQLRIRRYRWLAMDTA